MLFFNSPSLKSLLESYARTDKMWMKAYVLVAWVLDTIHEAFLMKAAYVYLVQDIADPLALEQFIS